MFTLDTTIDTIQAGKKQFVQTFVRNDAIAKALNGFIDAQSEYTKKATKVAMDTATLVAQETTKLAQESAKFDYSKFGEGFAKVMTGKF